MSLTVFLDLDRTLFNTTAFGLEKWRFLGDTYPQIDGQREHANQHNFYVQDGDSYAYDFATHLEALNLKVDEVYMALLQSEIADGRLEYAGVSDLVAWIRRHGEVRVLTYGIDDYQRLKASLCPSLEGVEVITTLRPKGEYLADKGRAWLVDDKPIGNQLPAGVRFIQVHMADKDSRPPASELGEVSTSLQGVLEILQNNI